MDATTLSWMLSSMRIPPEGRLGCRERNVVHVLFRFEIEYFTLEHFDTTSLAGDEEQFTGTALGKSNSELEIFFILSVKAGSRESLRYVKVYPYHYFSPSLTLLAGMDNLEELYLQRLDTSLQGLPDFSSLSNLK